MSQYYITGGRTFYCEIDFIVDKKIILRVRLSLSLIFYTFKPYTFFSQVLYGKNLFPGGSAVPVAGMF